MSQENHPPFASLDILGFDYELLPIEGDAASTAGAYGWCDTRKQHIRYCPDDSKERVKDTILHEIFHAVHHLSGIAEDATPEESKNVTEERRVKLLATMLRKVMLDNPGLSKYLFSR